MVISEVIEEEGSEDLNDDREYRDDYEHDCFVDPEVQRKRIRRILENQKSLYRFSTSASSSSSASCSSLSTASCRSKTTLLDLMRGSSTSLRRLFVMEHTSLADYFEDYSGSPMIKSIPLWGSDSDTDAHPDPWAFIRDAGQWRKEGGGEDHCRISRSVSRKSRSRSRDKEARVRSQDRIERKLDEKVMTSSRRLTRKKSFRKLPGFGFCGWRRSRFALRLRRRLRIIVCGRKL